MVCGCLYASLTQPIISTRATFAPIPQTRASASSLLLTTDFLAAASTFYFDGRALERFPSWFKSYWNSRGDFVMILRHSVFLCLLLAFLRLLTLEQKQGAVTTETSSGIVTATL